MLDRFFCVVLGLCILSPPLAALYFQGAQLHAVATMFWLTVFMALPAALSLCAANMAAPFRLTQIFAAGAGAAMNIALSAIFIAFLFAGGPGEVWFAFGIIYFLAMALLVLLTLATFLVTSMDMKLERLKEKELDRRRRTPAPRRQSVTA